MARNLLAILASAVLGFVVYMHVATHQPLANMAYGYIAAVLFAGCAITVHIFYKKGEVR